MTTKVKKFGELNTNLLHQIWEQYIQCFFSYRVITVGGLLLSSMMDGGWWMIGDGDGDDDDVKNILYGTNRVLEHQNYVIEHKCQQSNTSVAQLQV